MRKILEVGIADLAKSAMNTPFNEIRIEDLNSTALQEAFKSDIVEFYARGNIYILKSR